MKTTTDFLEDYYPEPNSGCWLWLGRLDKNDYPIAIVDGKYTFAHRLFYQVHKGNIPSGLTVDHLCFLPCCVNPQHLELKTNSDNARRQRSALKTHCVNGHEFTELNTYRRPNGSRDCRACIRLRAAKYRGAA